MSKTNGNKPSKVGRPRTLDEVKKGEILRIIGIGGSRKQAAKYVGCHNTTINAEAARDPEFCNRLIEAEGKAYEGYLTVISDAANKGDVKAAQWFLARRYPEEFGQMTKHAVTDASGKDLAPHQRQKLIDAIVQERKSIMQAED